MIGVHDRVRLIAESATSALDALIDVAWESTDASILRLCQLRIAAMLGDDIPARGQVSPDSPSEAKLVALESWWTSELFNARERARLAFTEQFVMSVSSMTDADIDALLAHDSESDVYQFVSAIYALDAETRIRLVSRSIFGADDTAGKDR